MDIRLTRIFFGILFIWLGLSAGPVGRYLGFYVTKTATDTSFGRDSIHIYYPTPADTIINRNAIDTITVIAETIYQGAPAYLMRVVTIDTVRQERVDTVCESGDTLLRQRGALGGFPMWLNRYLVPFRIGYWWRTGMEGTYYLDLNGDSLIDTLKILGDTTRVLDIEDVIVPYGRVNNCYKLLTVLRQVLHMTYEGIPMRETVYVKGYEWYKDSLWQVKDSTTFTGRAYIRLLIWLRFADITSFNLAQLTGIQSVAIRDVRAQREGIISLSPNPFRKELSIHFFDVSPIEILVYDINGRCVRRLKGPEVKWDGRDEKGVELAPGVYFLRAKNSSSLVIKAK